MPGYDGTGPAGMGSGTGRGAGNCRTAVMPGAGRGSYPRGGGRGKCFGGGMGMRKMIPNTYYRTEKSAPEQEEHNSLETQISILTEEIRNINNKLAELKQE